MSDLRIDANGDLVSTVTNMLYMDAYRPSICMVPAALYDQLETRYRRRAQRGARKLRRARKRRRGW